MIFDRTLTWPEYLAYEAEFGDVGHSILVKTVDGAIKVVPYSIWYNEYR